MALVAAGVAAWIVATGGRKAPTSLEVPAGVVRVEFGAAGAAQVRWTGGRADLPPLSGPEWRSVRDGWTATLSMARTAVRAPDVLDVVAAPETPWGRVREVLQAAGEPPARFRSVRLSTDGRSWLEAFLARRPPPDPDEPVVMRPHSGPLSSGVQYRQSALDLRDGNVFLRLSRGGEDDLPDGSTRVWVGFREVVRVPAGAGAADESYAEIRAAARRRRAAAAEYEEEVWGAEVEFTPPEGDRVPFLVVARTLAAIGPDFVRLTVVLPWDDLPAGFPVK